MLGILVGVVGGFVCKLGSVVPFCTVGKLQKKNISVNLERYAMSIDFHFFEQVFLSKTDRIPKKKNELEILQVSSKRE